MISSPLRFGLVLLAIFAFSYALPLRDSPEDAAISAESTEMVEKPETTAIDTLGESPSRVKRQGGCGCCGCGCCCCRPRCCCCCRRCCTCCRTCCCTRCCTCCRPCCGCGCGCGCGCCGCGGGGRKRRSLQNLRIKLAEKIENESREMEGSTIPEIAEIEEEKPEEVTEFPPPVFELVTETSK